MNTEGLSDLRTLLLISSILFTDEKIEEGQTGCQGWGPDMDPPRALAAPGHCSAQRSLRAGPTTQLRSRGSLSAP